MVARHRHPLSGGTEGPPFSVRQSLPAVGSQASSTAVPFVAASSLFKVAPLGAGLTFSRWRNSTGGNDGRRRRGRAPAVRDADARLKEALWPT
jgi:hypothetical protein